MSILDVGITTWALSSAGQNALQNLANLYGANPSQAIIQLIATAGANGIKLTYAQAQYLLANNYGVNPAQQEIANVEAMTQAAAQAAEKGIITTAGSTGTYWNPSVNDPPNMGFFWTANHDARILETLSVYGFTPDVILGLTILFNMRNKEGRAFLTDIFKKYMDTVNSICGHLAQAGAGNILTAYGHQIIIANVLEHNYMMQAGGAGGIESVLTPLVAVSEAGSIIDGLLGGQGFDIPSTLILAGVGVPEGATAEQTAELLRSVHGRGESGRAPPRQRHHIGTNTTLDGKSDKNPALDVEA